MTEKPERKFASRAGLKLAHALNEFNVDPTGLICADLGCNVGGFTDCLLQHGAESVHAVDTAYGTLDWNLRNDPRVTVLERTNALHLGDAKLKQPLPLFDLIVIDLGWTPQRLAIPAALPLLKEAPCAASPSPQSSSAPAPQIISLIKPHYELGTEEKRTLLKQGLLDEADAERVLDRTLSAMPALGASVIAWTQSPIRGGKSAKRNPGGGNVEYLVLLGRLYPAG